MTYTQTAFTGRTGARPITALTRELTRRIKVVDDTVNRRPKRTPYRRPKGTPFVERCDGYGGRAVRAGCGVGRA